MMLVDSHCHLDCLDLSVHQHHMDHVLENAQREGVEHFLCVAIELEKHLNLLKLEQSYPHIDISVGVHPNHKLEVDITEAHIMANARAAEVVAIGETGLDYYRIDTTQISRQQERFRRHIRVARMLKKPLIVHTRQAPEDTCRILREEKADDVGGVLHCFTESWDIAKRALDLGFFISFSGIITFKNAETVREVAKRVPLHALLIEADSPYLAPEPHRGKPNQPAYVSYVAQGLATLRDLSFQDIAQQTWDNYFRLFKRLPA